MGRLPGGYISSIEDAIGPAPERSGSPDPSHSGTNQARGPRPRTRPGAPGPAAAAATARSRRRARTATLRRAAARPPRTRGPHADDGRATPPRRRARRDRPARLGPGGGIADQAAAQGDADRRHHPRPSRDSGSDRVTEREQYREHGLVRATITRHRRRLPERCEQCGSRHGQRLERRPSGGAQRAVGDLPAPTEAAHASYDGAGAITSADSAATATADATSRTSARPASPTADPAPPRGDGPDPHSEFSNT